MRRHTSAENGLGRVDLRTPVGAHARCYADYVDGDGASGRSEEDGDQVADVRRLPAEWTGGRFERPGGGTVEGEVLTHLPQRFTAFEGDYVAAVLLNALDFAFVKGRRGALISGDRYGGDESEEEIDQMKDDHLRGVRSVLV